MEFTNGFWANFARERNPLATIRGTAKHISVSRQTLYAFLAGHIGCIGKKKILRLCRYWKVKWTELRQVIFDRASGANSEARPEIRSTKAV